MLLSNTVKVVGLTLAISLLATDAPAYATKNASFGHVDFERVLETLKVRLEAAESDESRQIVAVVPSSFQQYSPNREFETGQNRIEIWTTHSPAHMTDPKLDVKMPAHWIGNVHAEKLSLAASNLTIGIDVPDTTVSAQSDGNPELVDDIPTDIGDRMNDAANTQMQYATERDHFVQFLKLIANKIDFWVPNREGLSQGRLASTDKRVTKTRLDREQQVAQTLYHIGQGRRVPDNLLNKLLPQPSEIASTRPRPKPGQTIRQRDTR